jgi:hypothetical protein
LLIILSISLYAIKILNAIKNIKNRTCIIHSILSDIAFLPKIFFIIEFIVINKNLHQSKAGIGNKLNTHKFIEIIAHIIRMKIIQFEIDLVIKSTTQIGHET